MEDVFLLILLSQIQITRQLRFMWLMETPIFVHQVSTNKYKCSVYLVQLTQLYNALLNQHLHLHLLLLQMPPLKIVLQWTLVGHMNGKFMEASATSLLVIPHRNIHPQKSTVKM